MTPVHWLQRFRELLLEGTNELAEGRLLSTRWQERCHELDTELRGFDARAFEMMDRVGAGQQELDRLRSAQASFEQSASVLAESIQESMNAVQRGRRALNGYRVAGERQLLGPLYVERSI